MLSLAADFYGLPGNICQNDVIKDSISEEYTKDVPFFFCPKDAVQLQLLAQHDKDVVSTGHNLYIYIYILKSIYGVILQQLAPMFFKSFNNDGAEAQGAQCLSGWLGA